MKTDLGEDGKDHGDGEAEKERDGEPAQFAQEGEQGNVLSGGLWSGSRRGETGDVSNC